MPETPDYKWIPPHMHQSVDDYLQHGLRPGAFLYEVLCNNFPRAFMSADLDNQRMVLGWCQFMHWEMPTVAWGSCEKVEAWIAHKGWSGYDTRPSERDIKKG